MCFYTQCIVLHTFFVALPNKSWFTLFCRKIRFCNLHDDDGVDDGDDDGVDDGDDSGVVDGDDCGVDDGYDDGVDDGYDDGVDRQFPWRHPEPEHQDKPAVQEATQTFST